MLPMVAVAIEEKSAGGKLRALLKLKMNMEATESRIIVTYELTNIFPFG